MNNQIDWTKLSKGFVDTFHIGVGKDQVVLALQTGDDKKGFAFGRTIAKQFLLALNQAVEMYEKTYGKIDMEVGIPSTILLDTPPNKQSPPESKGKK